jgi:acyl carrier protein
MTPIGTIVREIIATTLELSADKVIPRALFVEDLAANLLDMIEIVLALEEAFEIKIPYDRAKRIRKVRGFIRCVTDLVPRGGYWHESNRLWQLSKQWNGCVAIPAVDAARAPAHLLRHLYGRD